MIWFPPTPDPTPRLIKHPTFGRADWRPKNYLLNGLKYVKTPGPRKTPAEMHVTGKFASLWPIRLLKGKKFIK